MYNLDDVEYTHTHTHLMTRFFMNLIVYSFCVDECMNFNVYESMNLFNMINYFLKC
jgi:hypothetical protein